jgi:hypothetical protein
MPAVTGPPSLTPRETNSTSSPASLGSRARTGVICRIRQQVEDLCVRRCPAVHQRGHGSVPTLTRSLPSSPAVPGASSTASCLATRPPPGRISSPASRVPTARGRNRTGHWHWRAGGYEHGPPAMTIAGRQPNEDDSERGRHGKDLVRGGEHVLLAARAVPEAAARVQPATSRRKTACGGVLSASVALRNARRR